MKEKEEKIGKGLYEQIKNNEKLGIQYPLTKERLLELTETLFTKRKERDPEETITLPLEWKYCEWKEKGKTKSCWKLMAGNLYTIAVTGDGGKEEIDEMFKEMIKDL